MDGTINSAATRRRVAAEMIAKHERTLRRTARRYSICAADADDALQRALEILLTKAPPGEARELVRWMQTVTKHEALAVRRSRERQLAPAPPAADPEETVDWVSLIPATGAGPAERAESREEIARTREGLKTLKADELRALTLLAQGYSYAEIGETTGWTRTKINRALAEGRERFRAFISRSEAGGRCAELAPLLSAFCDGEAGAPEAEAVREHLRACAHCRAAIRAYRAAPRAARALAPVPLGGALLGRLHEAFGRLGARLPGRTGVESAATQVATTGGARGAGFAGLAKLLAVCAGTAGGAAACVGAGVLPAPAALTADRPVVATPVPALEDREPPAEEGPSEPQSTAPVGEPAEKQTSEPKDAKPPAAEPAASEPAAEAGAIEYVPPPAPAAPPPEAAPAASSGSGSAAGEFGP